MTSQSAKREEGPNILCHMLLIHSQEGIDESVVEIHDLVVPALDGSLPTSGEMSEFVQILSDFETFDSSTFRTIVIRDASIRPSLSAELKLLVPDLHLRY